MFHRQAGGGKRSGRPKMGIGVTARAGPRGRAPPRSSSAPSRPRTRPVPGAVVAPGIGQRIAQVEHGVDPIGDEAVGFADDLGRRAHDDRVRRDDGVVGNEAVPGNYAVVSDHRTFHHRGADADQAIVADGAPVQNRAVGDGAVVSDDGRRAIAHVHDHVVLKVAEAADAHVAAFRPDDGVRPQARSLADLDCPERSCGGVYVGGIREPLLDIRCQIGAPGCAQPPYHRASSLTAAPGAGQGTGQCRPYKDGSHGYR